MKSKQTLMTALVGLAMLATPVVAFAKDHGRGNFSRSVAVNQVRTPAFSGRNYVRNENRSGNGMWMAPHQGGHWGDADDHWNNGRRWGNADEYRNYGRHWDHDDEYRNYGGNGYYQPAPVAYPAYGYGAGQGYGYGYNSGCAKAQRVMNNYWKDRNTGHPAAAADLLRQNRWAVNSGCVGAGPGAVAPMGGGLLGGLMGQGYGGYNRPAYGGGYNGGYAAPYGGAGYGQPYGQPYGGGSMLAPLLQQFIH